MAVSEVRSLFGETNQELMTGTHSSLQQAILQSTHLVRRTIGGTPAAKEFIPLSTGQDDTHEAGVSHTADCFTDDTLLKPLGKSFRQGWQEAQCGQTRPVPTLWDGVAETHKETMADFFVGYAGTVNSREIHPEGTHLSQDTGRKFKELMLKKHRKGKL